MDGRYEDDASGSVLHSHLLGPLRLELGTPIRCHGRVSQCTGDDHRDDTRLSSESFLPQDA